MELQMQQTGYQAALSVTAKSLQPTLLDFLK
jgi:flagellar hook-associated protein 3 FlgL